MSDVTHHIDSEQPAKPRMSGVQVATARRASGRWPVKPETLKARLKRLSLALAYVCMPKRIVGVPALMLRTLSFYTTPKAQRTLPSTDNPLPGREGVVGFLHDTAPKVIMEGLRQGMILNGHAGPIKWQAPRERCILLPQNLHIEKNLARLLRKERFTLTLDRDPLGVVEGCAAPRAGQTPLTWLHPRMQHVLMDLFDAGIMHTVEVHDESGTLVGGLMGYAVDDLFLIQSQFHTVRDASKVATVGLMAHLTDWGFTGADGSYMTGYLKSFGFQNLSRGALASMQTCRPTGPRVRWTYDKSFDLGRWKPADGPCPRKAADKEA